MSARNTQKTGFTLLEILLVVGIIAILAGIVILALNPTKQFAMVRNTQRKANLSELNKALYQYYIDHSHYPVTLTTTLTEICDTEATSTGHSLNCTNKIDLSPLVPTYLTAIPTDPQASGTTTGYYVAKNTANKIHLKADNAELAQTTTIGDTTGVLPDHLVSYWSFDGNANDSWGGNNGMVYGATATTGVKGVASTAYAFSGVNDRIDTGSDSIGINSITFSAWIYPTGYGASSQGRIVDNRMFFLRYDSGNVLYLFSDGATPASSGGNSVLLNIWQHIVVTRNAGGVANFYVNGIQKGNANQSSGTPIAGTSNVFIGNNNINNRNWNGTIDNVRVYNKALTADEVLNIYNTEKP